MTKVLTRSILPFLLLAAAIITCSWYVVNSTAFAERPSLISIASTIDLTLLIPGIYFLFIRKTKIPKLTVIPVFLLSILAASYLIPTEHQQTLGYLKMAIPLIELVVIGTIIYHVRKTFKAYDTQKKSGKRQGFVETVHMAAQKGYGKGVFANVMATEISVFHYAILGWNPQIEAPKGQRFTYHKESGYVSLFAVALFAVVAETAILHLLLTQWSVVAAWILTGISIYSLFFILGDFNAIKKRPIYLANDVLKIRIGLRWRVDIPVDAIESVELRVPDKEKEDFANFILSSEANVVLNLKQEFTALGLYGLNKRFTKLAIQPDDRQEFKRVIDTHISEAQ